MTKEYFLPPAFFNEIEVFAKKEGLIEVLNVTNKHTNGTIFLEPWECKILLNIAKFWRLKAELNFPFWDAEHPHYNPEHEEAFFDAQEETWGKIAMTFPETPDH
ncbi:hypothetical protein [Litoribacillus peritrichatus]|uniref:Uncharacterized protein n=1 Tax=Litoribacillus peritrichatus TaxID=718191 RepID=A0ABP7MPQ7_9GAMM